MGVSADGDAGSPTVARVVAVLGIGLVLGLGGLSFDGWVGLLLGLLAGLGLGLRLTRRGGALGDLVGSPDDFMSDGDGGPEEPRPGAIDWSLDPEVEAPEGPEAGGASRWRAAKPWIGGAGFIAIIWLLDAGYRWSKSCSYGRVFLVFLFGPPLIGVVVGAIVPDQVVSKIVLAIVSAVGLFVLAFGVLLSGDGAGFCGGY